ncbi:MAG: hypothetical protein LIO60_02640 [Oscillospiraceae bacterium]|nr:hypothetical protein [Oscillospiraceae bacterium]
MQGQHPLSFSSFHSSVTFDGIIFTSVGSHRLVRYYSLHRGKIYPAKKCRRWQIFSTPDVKDAIASCAVFFYNRDMEALQTKPISRCARWFRLCPARHILCAAALALLGAYLALRRSAAAMEIVAATFVRPWHRYMSRLTSHVPFSVAECLIVAGVIAALIYIVFFSRVSAAPLGKAAPRLSLRTDLPFRRAADLRRLLPVLGRLL